MNEHMQAPSREELLEAIRQERKALVVLIAPLAPETLCQPGAVGHWSIKDTLAHISTWERWMQAWIGAHLKGEPPATPEPWDIERMNAGTYERVKDMPLKEVLAEFDRCYQDSFILVESLSQEQLDQVYTDTWPMGPLWLGVAANLNFHYKEHHQDLITWLSTRNEGQ